MTVETSIMITIGALSVSGLVWLIRLEGRVNTHQELHRALREDLTYIRNRIDRALNGRDEH